MIAARLAAPLFLAAALLLGSSAHADPSAADKRSADSLVLEGKRLLKAGDAAAALEKFQAAYALTRAPTTGLEVAMAFEAMGKLVEARAMVVKVGQLPGETIEPWAHKQARASAASAIEALDTRIPSLVLRIQGAPKETVTATVDGFPVPAESLAAPLQFNPGKREVVVTAPGYRTAKTTVELVEGVVQPVEVPIALEREAISKTSSMNDDSRPVRNDVIVYAGIGVSGALAVVALGTGIGAYDAQMRADRNFERAGCSGSLADPLECELNFNEQEEKRVLLGNIAIWTAIGAGAVGAATGLYALLTRTPEDTPPKQSVRVSPTVGGIVVSGTF